MACFSTWDIQNCGCAGTGCGACCLTCGPCDIPKADLTFTWAGDGPLSPWNVPGSITLRYRPGTGDWLSGCMDMGGGGAGSSASIRLTCSGGYTVIRVVITTGHTCSGSVVDSRCCSNNTGIGCDSAIGTATCNPFNLAFTLTFVGTSTITSPAYGATTCCQTFTVNGCNSLVLSGATVNVYDTSGGTLLASGTTDAGGNVTLLWSGSCSCYVTATEATGRLTAYGSSLSLTANSTTVLSMLPAASGYTCDSACTLPISNTLHATFPSAGTKTLTFSGGAWTSSFSQSGHAYVITLTVATNVMTITRDGVSCGAVTWSITTCPPSFAATITVPAGSCNTELGGNGTLTE